MVPFVYNDNMKTFSYLIIGIILFSAALSMNGWTSLFVGGAGLSMILSGFISFMEMIGNITNHFLKTPPSHPGQHDTQS